MGGFFRTEAGVSPLGAPTTIGAMTEEDIALAGMLQASFIHGYLLLKVCSSKHSD